MNKRNDECMELKNIKYKTMIKNGAPLKETKESKNITNLEQFLENEKQAHNAEPWCKLDKTVKFNKLMEFVDIYKETNTLDETETGLLINFLKICLDKKKLHRVKDVIYDKSTGVIKEIPALVYTKTSRHFTLKNLDKRVSTLKSLAPKKNLNSTIKNKSPDSEEDEDEGEK